MNVILIIIALYLLLIFDFTATYTTTKREFKIEYSGLLWVGLDYLTIWTYESNDKPQKWINIKIIKP